jgi:hypothetical protein
LLRDIRELLSYSGLYIKTGSFPSIPPPLSLAVALDVFGMIGSVFLQVPGMLIEPLFDARVVVETTARILSSPAGIVLSFEGFLTGNLSTDLLPLPSSPWRRNKKGVAVGTLPRHRHLFL